LGITLTEVLISMGILTLGLLGVAALIPVGGFYQQKAEIADRASAIAQAAMNELVTSGMLDPRAWRVMTPFPKNTAPAQWNTYFPSDGNAGTSQFVRPFAAALSQALAQTQTLNDRTLIGRQFGSAFVIDPLGVATLALRDGSNSNRNQVALPYPSSVFSLSTSPFYTAWQTAGLGYTGQTWPIRRVTFHQSDKWPMDFRTAGYHFRGRDDLAFDFPTRDDRPAIQNWDVANVGNTLVPLARQWSGDYSWLISVVPLTTAARDAMATNPASYSYEVSVVVFYKRAMNPAIPTNNAELISAAAYERGVAARIVSSGITGGEVLLERIPASQENIPQSDDPFTQLKIGNWIMLCGPHPNSSTAEPRFVMKWYEVISVERQAPGITNPVTQRLVTLRGPEWPWRPGGTYANNLCAAIVRGAVTVHTKTMRLEGGSSAWAMR